MHETKYNTYSVQNTKSGASTFVKKIYPFYGQIQRSNNDQYRRDNLTYYSKKIILAK